MYVKRLIFSCCTSLITIAAMGQFLSHNENEPIGWANVKVPTTGSDNENPVTVSTAEELKAALKAQGKKTIYIKGNIAFRGQMSVDGATDKTVYGLPGSVLSNPIHSDDKDKSGILILKNCRNIVLRNLTFKSSGAYDIDGKDNLTLQNSQHIWIDHCDFQDGVDGNLDCQHATDFVSITWCRFRYLIAPWKGGSGGARDHRYTNLIGSSDKNGDEDDGHLRITYANCWWDEGCRERMPRIRFGQVHVVNCLYSSSVANYCIGTGYRCNAYVEKCVFINQSHPWKNYATSGSYTDYNITVTDCIGADDVQSLSGERAFFNPYVLEGYSLKPIDKEQVEKSVKEGAGAILNIEEKDVIGKPLAKYLYTKE